MYVHRFVDCSCCLTANSCFAFANCLSRFFDFLFTLFAIIISLIFGSLSLSLSSPSPSPPLFPSSTPVPTKNFKQATITLVVLAKHPVARTFTVFASFQMFFLYNSIIMSADIFAALALESFNIENIKFWRVVLIFVFFCLEFIFLMSAIICVSRNCLKFLSWHLKS